MIRDNEEGVSVQGIEMCTGVEICLSAKGCLLYRFWWSGRLEYWRERATEGVVN